MDIGGIDLVLPGAPTPRDLQTLLRALQERWPEAVVEVDIILPIQMAIEHDWGLQEDLFLFENDAAQASWTAHGMTDDNEGQLIAVTLQPDAIAFVVGDTGTQSYEVVQELMAAVQRTRPSV